MGYEAIINAISALSKGSSQAGASLSLLTDLGMEAYGLFDEDARRSMYNAKTQSGLTVAQQMANQFNHNEAQISRDFSEMQRQTNYQTAVNDMVAAGLNPAMMYGGGNGYAASSTASAQATSTNMSARDRNMADVLGKAMLGLQMEQAEANIELTKAQAAGIRKENEWIDVKNNAYINDIQSQIDERKSVINLNGAKFARETAEAGLANAKKLLADQEYAQNEKIYPLMVEFQKIANKLEQAKVNLTNAQQKLTEQQEKLVIEQAKQIIELTRKAGFEADILGLDAKTFEEFAKSNPDAYTAMRIVQAAGATGSIIVGSMEAGENMNKASNGGTDYFKNKRKNSPHAIGNIFHPRNRNGGGSR